MDASANVEPARRGFTLVEMLVVIVIIGILMGLITGVAVTARARVKEAVITLEIKELDKAVTNCTTEYKNLPPDFTDASAVSAFIRDAFPRYRYVANPAAGDDPADFVDPPDPSLQPFYQMLRDLSNPPDHPRRPGYGITIDLAALDPASALLFWLGGLPETPPVAGGQWIPAGFHKDPTLPFKPGLPRTPPLYGEFDPDRIPVDAATGWPVEPHPDDPTVVRFFRYYPKGVDVPYVYFRARRLAGVWGYFVTGGQVAYQHSVGDAASGMAANICVAYQDPQNPPLWRNHDTCQIIAAGLDGEFGAGDSATLRVSKTGLNFSQGDYDNLTNFSEGTLEDEIE